MGPEMAAPILWAPGKCVLSAGKPMPIKFLFLGGGGILGFGRGGGSADFIFMGARIFLIREWQPCFPRKVATYHWIGNHYLIDSKNDIGK